MLNLPSNELKLIAKSRLLSALNVSESVKIGEDYDADEILKTTMPDPTKINKTIGEIRNKTAMKTKYLET